MLPVCGTNVGVVAVSEGARFPQHRTAKAQKQRPSDVGEGIAVLSLGSAGVLPRSGFGVQACGTPTAAPASRSAQFLM